MWSAPSLNKLGVIKAHAARVRLDYFVEAFYAWSQFLNMQGN